MQMRIELMKMVYKSLMEKETGRERGRSLWLLTAGVEQQGGETAVSAGTSMSALKGGQERSGVPSVHSGQ